MYRLRNLALLSGTVAAALVAWSCDRPATSVGPQPDQPLFWEGEEEEEQCPVKKFTGGGRIDPPENTAPGGFGGTMNGKVTFGFNIHVNGDCQPIKGQLQVVHHPSQTKFHAGTTSSGGSFDSFTSYPSPEGGECGEWHGTIRVKHGNGPSHDYHRFGVQVCDNGEPGSSPGAGPDTFWFNIEDDASFGHGNTNRTYLTGGNIQAH